MQKVPLSSFKINSNQPKLNAIVPLTVLSRNKMHLSAPKTNIINAAKMNMNIPNMPPNSHRGNIQSLKSNYTPLKVSSNGPKTNIFSTNNGHMNIANNFRNDNKLSNANYSNHVLVPKKLISTQKQSELGSKKSFQMSKSNVNSYKMNMSAQQGYCLIKQNTNNLQFVIMDVRTNSQFASQRLQNAIHLPLSDLQDKLEKLNNNKIYFVYCRSGARSSTAAGILRRNGFNNVINMVGGIGSWNDFDYPTISGQPKHQQINHQQGNHQEFKHQQANHQSKTVQPTKVNFKSNMSAEQAYKFIQSHSKNHDFVLLDVRSSSQNSSERIDNSMHISVSDIEDKLHKLDKNKIYLVYCRSGARSSIAAGILRSHGFNHVINMVGGISSWIDDEYPTVQGQGTDKKSQVQVPKISLKANIGPQQAYQLIKQNADNHNFVILDVRSSSEHSSEKIANSINISVSDIEHKLKNLDKSKTYLVYCRSGARSSSAASTLRQHGFIHVTNMSGGISSWISNGFAVL